MSDSTSKRNVSHPNRCLNWKCFPRKTLKRRSKFSLYIFCLFWRKFIDITSVHFTLNDMGNFLLKTFPLASTNIREIQLFCDLCNCQVITLKYSFSAVAGKTPEWCYEWTGEIRETRLVAERAKIQVEVEEVCSELNTQRRNFLSLAFVEFFREGEIHNLSIYAQILMFTKIYAQISPTT